MFFDLVWIFPDRYAVYERIARCWIQDSREHSHCSRFARAIGADQTEEFTFFDSEVQTPDSLDPAKIFTKSLDQDGWRGGFLSLRFRHGLSLDHFLGVVADQNITFRRHANFQFLILVWNSNFNPVNLFDTFFFRLNVFRSEFGS